MEPADYYRSLTAETNALGDRIRQLMDAPHWLTDGEWKESVLRSVIRRHLPASILVGRGFVIAEARCSTQIDILLYDAGFPLLHRDGDLVFLTPDAVRGIIEVKSTLDAATLRTAARKLADVADLLPMGADSAFVGLFGYESRRSVEATLDVLHEIAAGNRRRVVNHVCAGSDNFVRFWSTDPHDRDVLLDAWRIYPMQDLARGYFIFNAVESAVGTAVSNNTWAWFPSQDKQSLCERRLGERSARTK